MRANRRNLFMQIHQIHNVPPQRKYIQSEPQNFEIPKHSQLVVNDMLLGLTDGVLFKQMYPNQKIAL